MQTRTKIMNWFSWEGLFRLCEGVSIGAGVITVAALIGQVVAGHVLSKRQDETILKLETGLADAKTKQAEAEVRLQRLRNPRMLDFRHFVDTLKGTPKGKVEIIYDPV